MRRLDPAGLIRGALVAVAICLPLAIVSDIAIDEDDPSPIAIPLFLSILLGFAAAGWVGSRAAEAMPLATGAVAALAGFAVVQTAGLVIAVVGDGNVALAGVVFSGLLAYGSGLTGAVLGERRRTR